LKGATMKAIRVFVDNGQIMPEEPLDAGRHDAILVMLDPDPWERLIDDPRPRPELTKAGQEALDEHLRGMTTPLDPDSMP
jgi:hypothetical protein